MSIGYRMVREKLMTSETGFSFVIDTEITASSFDELLKFIQHNYINVHPAWFADVKRTAADQERLLSFTLLGPEGRWHIDVEIRTGKPIRVKISPRDGMVPQGVLDQLREDLFIGVQLFEEQVRKTTLYFAWVEGERVALEEAPEKRRDIIRKMFSESMLVFFIVFIAASILLFMVFGQYAVILLVALQFLMVLFSDKIIARMANWSITPEKPSVHIFQYHLPVEEYKGFSQRFSREMLMKMKAEIYNRTLAVGKAVDCETAAEIFSKHDFKCVPENLSTRVVNVYDIVRKAAEKFMLPVPKIVIANTIMPNAAASGPSPSRGVILITTGLLVQLEDDEILSVVGHEFSHLSGRDPLILFSLTAAEYLLRVYVFFDLFFSFFFGYLYLFVALTTVYFIAKFFEGRADLEAAVKIGRPDVLAEALRKIGFRRLQFERLPSYRIEEWVGWDPHPPLYFRVARLESLTAPEKVKHPLVQSIKDNIRGLLEALGLVRSQPL